MHGLQTEIFGLASKILECERQGDSAATETRLNEVCRLRNSLLAAMRDL